MIVAVIVTNGTIPAEPRFNYLKARIRYKKLVYENCL